MESIKLFLQEYVDWSYFPRISFVDIVEMLIIAYLLFHLMKWIKNTKAWMLLRGIIVITLFIFMAAIFNMQTILFIVNESISVLAIGAVVVFQPELRRALEQLGNKNFFGSISVFDKNKESLRFSGHTTDAITTACFEMGKVKIGALIVVEQDIVLEEYIKTGIEMDCILSKQVLVNIFEHNTPLHDGAVIVRGDRIKAATCYLPLSDNMNLSKQLGTRHRAAVGMSENSDALVIIVSEETGYISIAYRGALRLNITEVALKKELMTLSKLHVETKKRSFGLAGLKRGRSDEE